MPHRLTRIPYRRLLRSAPALALTTAAWLQSPALALTAATWLQPPALALTATTWLQPPAVLPIPSANGPEGPPRPYGAEPSPGVSPPPTNPSIARAQNHALLYGPFPRGGLTRGISDATLTMSPDATVREQALARIRATGASVVRIPVEWRYIVSGDPPSGFDASDPASPAYDFTKVDAAVRDAAAAGLTPLLVVTSAPDFAEAPHRWPYAYPGSWAPNPAAFGEFATAVARRYDGSFPDPLQPGRALPRVRLLEAWNEPNLARYLEPQWVVEGGRWRAFSPLLYRQLLNAFYAAVKAVEPSDTVIATGVAPNGEPAGVGRMTPVRFLRGMLCLEGGKGGGKGEVRAVKRGGAMVEGGHRAANGGAPKAQGLARAAGMGAGSVRTACPDPPHFDVLAFHPLSFESPDRPAASSQDVAIADIAKVTALLARAERAHTALPRAHKPVWVTELNWESAPQSAHGVPGRLQALWISRALHRLWIAGVSMAEWQFLIDPYPGVPLATSTGGVVYVPRPAGLYSAGVVDGRSEPAAARPKPFLRGFTLPFDPLRVDRRHVRVWALLMRPGQRVLLQRSTRSGGWRTIARLRADGYAVLNQLVRLHGAAALRLVSAGLPSAPVAVPAVGSRL
ncbi:MAG TPA: hypothetical protein VG147_05120 [Solirubrobacteraceae bacterium]|nr:hypothetical protein [Solirubrobacteraceae bacterium]